MTPGKYKRPCPACASHGRTPALISLQAQRCMACHTDDRRKLSAEKQAKTGDRKSREAAALENVIRRAWADGSAYERAEIERLNPGMSFSKPDCIIDSHVKS